MAKEASGPASRLRFTAGGRVSPEPTPYIKQAKKRVDRLGTVRSVFPNRRVVTKKAAYNETKGGTKGKLHFRKMEKHPSKLKLNPTSHPVQEAGLCLHGKTHKVEQKNAGIEDDHKTEELIKRQADKALRSTRRRNKLKPYRAAAKAERESIAASAEFAHQKSLRNNPELIQAVVNPIPRLWQKQHIRRRCIKAAWAADRGAADSVRTTASITRKAAGKGKQAASLMARYWKRALLIGDVGLMSLFLMGGLQLCAAMFSSAGMELAAIPYPSEGNNMLRAEAVYAGIEADLQYELDHYETLHPGYDGYHFELGRIDHDPYILTSILFMLYNDVSILGKVQDDLAMLFEWQCIPTQTAETGICYRTETSTDSEGSRYEEEVPYIYYIYSVTLENRGLSHLPVSLIDEEVLNLCTIYMQTLGNQSDLSPSNSYPDTPTVKESIYHEIPPEALKNGVFAAVITEARKYVGFPYIWDGSSPSTSFDCSGLINWVVNHSGWNMRRQATQGFYGLCTPASPKQARPSDLVFFAGTYDTTGMSHVGLYAGNSVMSHYDDSISYANLNSSYQ